MISFVCGFAFDIKGESVVLIEKNRPSALAGMHNGVGGRIEFDERPQDAMAREFYEETGLIVTNWAQFAQIMYLRDKLIIHFFFTYLQNLSENYRLTKTTDETPNWVKISDLNNVNVVPDLKWLIPMALSPVRVNIRGTIDRDFKNSNMFTPISDLPDF